MTWLLLTIYLLFFSWLLLRIPFIRQTGLPPVWIIGLFLLKVAAGMAYGWVHTTLSN